ncbi:MULTISPECIES: S9 family peptidase [Lysobacter]|uniref:S9 family peptidase n=1 Tax=Lysobacter TaxID=68 RepID=UPI001F30BCF2|nr:MULTISPECIES: alpha/beta fold hydrolase [Lysobacter]UJB18605.1 alpha/beta fold hydrolase [Lysobacter capsici]UJQ27670.1 alpha/beta fold hydrolase [Lysobacter gummosus]
MSLRHVLTFTALALACAGTAHARDAAQTGSEVVRQEQGNRVSENVPTIPAELLERLNRYQNTRGASFGGWTHGGCLLIATRFAETAQAHRVCQPLGMREQLTFYPEPVNNLTVAPAPANGFVFGKDVGGNEFWQLHYFDLATRQVSLLTDGKARNQNPLFSHDGKQFAYSSTARNGRDIDVWVMDFATRKARAVVTDGGTWSAQDFSPDGKQLLVIKFVSAGESYPGLVDLDSGKLSMFPIDGGKASISDFRFSRDGRAVYFVSDEPVDGKPQEFRTLRRHEPSTGKFEVLSANIPWDVDQLALAEDGKHLLFVSNEDGVGKLHVLSLPQHKEIKLPALPVGVIGRADFSPDGKRIALAINTATSPSDLYVIDLASAKLARWTRSEVGGLDSTRFVTPSLIRYPTFDTVDGGARRTIPAFYYKPAQAPAGKKLPVVINIHGGPEGQSQPSFNATAQFLANELGVAMLVPNVRGSSGYGRTYLSLDNAEKRENSVKDIGALLDWVGQQPELDAQRVGVYGGSYGGYMVLASLTHYSDRIRAGVDVVGISDFTTFLNNTESYRRDLRRAEYGDERVPEMKAVFDRISPLKNAGKIASPLFVAQGKNDPRVPYTEAEQIVKAVRANGQPVWFLMFNDEGHGFQKKANTDYFGAAMMEFWQRHLMGGE